MSIAAEEVDIAGIATADEVHPALCGSTQRIQEAILSGDNEEAQRALAIFLLMAPAGRVRTARGELINRVTWILAAGPEQGEAAKAQQALLEVENRWPIGGSRRLLR